MPNDAFTRDASGRIVQSTNEVPVEVDADGVGGDPAVVQVSAECFTYDGFNRLTSAWTVADASTPTCGGVAPADDTVTGWDASGTAYAAQWDYSLGGKIDALTQSVAGAASAVTGYEYSTSHPAAATSTTTSTTTGSASDAFAYDAAGRMVSRTVDDVTTALTWDVTSSLVESGKPGVVGGVSTGQGGHVVYAYDASGQRVLQARVPDASHTGSATGYVGFGEVTDTDTTTPAVASSLQASRYYPFGGATVAVLTPAGLALMLGDEQGSVSVTMPVSVDTATGVVSPATMADALAATRTAYTPYGVLRGDDNLAIDRGWLGQTEDRIEGTGLSSTGTGLTYLNARYYDPVLGRFLSPDPLMDLGDPRTLDPYRYADNNPVVFTDASGLKPIGQCDCVGSSCKSASANAIVKAAKSSANIQLSFRIIAQITKDQASARTPTQEFFHVDSSTFKAGGLGLVNFGGGAVNGLSSMVNGVTALSPHRYMFEHATGKSLNIPSVGIVGDYDTYKYSSWSGTGSSVLASFMLGGGGAAASSSTKTASLFSKLKFSENGIAAFSDLRFLSQGQKGEVQIHHLVEQRFARVMEEVLGSNTNQWASVAVTRVEHQVFTNAWRAEIGYGRGGTGVASADDVMGAAQRIYANYPEILKALPF